MSRKDRVVLWLFTVLLAVIVAGAIRTSGGGGASVSDVAYNATSWNGVTTIAPSKNAVRDKIESLGASHDAVTLDVDAAVLLDLSTQEIGLDTQTANCIVAGPSSGGANEPTCRTAVDDDIPDTITLTNLTQVTTRSHTALSDIGTNTHAQVDTHIADLTNPHATDIGNLGAGTLAELNTALSDATLTESSMDAAVDGGASAFDVPHTDPAIWCVDDDADNDCTDEPRIELYVDTGTDTPTLQLLDAADNVLPVEHTGGTLRAPINIIAATYTMTTADCGNMINNDDADALEVDLIADPTDCFVCVYDNAGGAITVDPNGTDTITEHQTAGAAGEAAILESGAGNMACFHGTSTTNWDAKITDPDKLDEETP